MSCCATIQFISACWQISAVLRCQAGRAPFQGLVNLAPKAAAFVHSLVAVFDGAECFLAVRRNTIAGRERPELRHCRPSIAARERQVTAPFQTFSGGYLSNLLG